MNSMFITELCGKARDGGRKQHGPGIGSSFESLGTKTETETKKRSNRKKIEGFRRTAHQTEIDMDTKDWKEAASFRVAVVLSV